MPAAGKASAGRARVNEVLGGKYRLEKLLGSGAMGQVYRAKELETGRTVAVKVMREEQAHNTTTVTRFLREARAAKKVRHPNVVVVYDIALDDDGAPFIVQELLHGEDLARCLKTSGGTLSAEIALDLLVPIVDAVAVAHANGVVHRDLKPANVYLARIDGVTVPKLLDFGISQLVDTEDAARLTATGMALGTPAYMAPEQVMGSKEIDARTDVWSLGVMLHELLAGTLPFAVDVPSALFVAICTTDPVPLDEAAPGVSIELARIVARCLRRDRRDRYATAAELADDLRAVREGRPAKVDLASVATIAAPVPALPAVRAKTRSVPVLPPAPASTEAIELREFPIGVRGDDDDNDEVRFSLASLRPPPGMQARAQHASISPAAPARAMRAMFGMLLLSAIAIGGAAALSVALASDAALSELTSARVPEGAPSVAVGAAALGVCGLVGWSAWSAWRASETFSALARAAIVAVLLVVALHFLRG